MAWMFKEIVFRVWDDATMTWVTVEPEVLVLLLNEDE